jgi:rhamnosyltransferase
MSESAPLPFNIALIIPTLNGGKDFKRLLKSLENQDLTIKHKLVVDSASDDETVALAQKAGFKVTSIARKDFNHGRTRQEAIESLEDCDIAIFMTQDACCKDINSLSLLVSAFRNSEVALAYGRQIPYSHHNPLSQHARFFNYPKSGYIRGLKDKKEHGIKTVFFSNSFSAYRIKTLKDLGGFPSDIILGEDVFITAKALLNHHKVAYVSEACVHHSHDFSLLQEFKSYFDYGVFHKKENWIVENFAALNKTGFNYAFSEMKYLLTKAPYFLPLSFLRSASKWLAYNLGKHYKKFSTASLKKISRHPGYWF